jgi:hypothetical protein
MRQPNDNLSGAHVMTLARDPSADALEPFSVGPQTNRRIRCGQGEIGETVELVPRDFGKDRRIPDFRSWDDHDLLSPAGKEP